MKRFLALALISTSVFAAEQKLLCKGTHNYELVMENVVSLSSGQKNLEVGTVANFEVLVSSLENQSVELQAFNPIDPSRTYSTAVLRSANDEVKLSVWTREFLVEIECKLMNMKR